MLCARLFISAHNILFLPLASSPINRDRSRQDPIQTITAKPMTTEHQSNEAGLSPGDLLKAIQVKGKDGKPTPVARTLQRKLEELIKKRQVVFFSISSGKYQLTPGYAAYRASFHTHNTNI
jgi:hypothetical protein